MRSDCKFMYRSLLIFERELVNLFVVRQFLETVKKAVAGLLIS